jgi:hypothetical protein
LGGPPPTAPPKPLRRRHRHHRRSLPPPAAAARLPARSTLLRLAPGCALAQRCRSHLALKQATLDPDQSSGRDRSPAAARTPKLAPGRPHRPPCPPQASPPAAPPARPARAPATHPHPWLTCAIGRTASSPKSSPSGAKALRNVDATNTPPGRSTRLISASAAWGLGQQWIAAPAWMASTEPVAKGRRAMSARTQTMGVALGGRGKGRPACGLGPRFALGARAGRARASLARDKQCSRPGARSKAPAAPKPRPL